MTSGQEAEVVGTKPQCGKVHSCDRGPAPLLGSLYFTHAELLAWEWESALRTARSFTKVLLVPVRLQGL